LGRHRKQDTIEPVMNGKRRIGILVFDDVEVLDFAGPFEVFSRTRLTPGVESRRSEESAPFEVFTVAPRPGPVRATGGLTIMPRYDFATAPPIDIVLVPGGFGTRPLLQDAEVLAWLRRTASAAQRVTSVCTGALLLARAGLLSGRRATTHWSSLERLTGLDATITVLGERRVVDDVVMTSAGVSAGIDLAFALVAAYCGRDVAVETARYIDYPFLEKEL
jgi:transcriptional regulator GlxA family with amidase domain